jgi:hypothetical protein
MLLTFVSLALFRKDANGILDAALTPNKFIYTSVRNLLDALFAFGKALMSSYKAINQYSYVTISLDVNLLKADLECIRCGQFKSLINTVGWFPEHRLPVVID